MLALVCGLGTPHVTGADISNTYSWDPVKLGAGGWPRGMVVHPAVANVRYARTDTCPPFRWDVAKNQWMPLVTRSSMPLSVPQGTGGAAGAIAVDPSDATGGKLLIAWKNSVFRSANGGLNFTESTGIASVEIDANNASGERIQFDPNNGNIVYYGSYKDGLWISTDGGQSWTQTTNPFSATTNVRQPVFDKSSGTVVRNIGGVDFTLTRRVYIVTNAKQVWMTNDGGSTWADISTGTSASARSNFSTVANGALLSCDSGTKGKLWKYTPVTGLWTSTTLGGFTANLCGIAVDRANEQRIIVHQSASGRESITFNGGTTWKHLGKSYYTGGFGWMDPTGLSGYSHGGIMFDQQASTPTVARVWVPFGNEGIMRADISDAATAAPWIIDSRGIEQFVPMIVSNPPADPAVPGSGGPVFSVQDAAWLTTPNTENYVAKVSSILTTNNLNLNNGHGVAYCPNKPSYVVATSYNFYNTGQSGNGSGYSTDGGTTWTSFASIVKTTNSYGTFLQNNPSKLVAGCIAVSARAAGVGLGQDNIVWFPASTDTWNRPPAPYFSTDGGATWTQTQTLGSLVTSGSLNDGIRRMDFQSGLFNFSVRGEYLVADSVTPGTFYLYAPLGDGNASSRTFFKSTDGGVTWVQTGGSRPLVNYAFASQLRAVPGHSGHLWFSTGNQGTLSGQQSLKRSTNGGANWSTISSISAIAGMCLGKSATIGGYPTLYVAGTINGSHGIHRSIDEGATWDKLVIYPYDMLSNIGSMAASWETFGKVYCGIAGQSFLQGRIAEIVAPPAAPSALDATTISSSQINLAWTDNSTNEAQFEIERKTGVGGIWATIVATAANTAAYQNTGLSAATQYYYRVRASNSGGPSAYSNEVNATTSAAALPTAPSGLAATAVSSSQINLVWIDNSTNETGFLLERKTGVGGTWAQIASLTAGTSFHQNTGLTQASQYFYRVRATNLTGESAYSNETNATTQAGAVPFNLFLNGQLITLGAWSSYDAGQDGAGSTPTSVTVSPDGLSATLAGNAWKRAGFVMTVTADTIMEFTVSASDTGEIAGIALDNDTAPISGRRAFRFGGADVDDTPGDSWSWKLVPTYIAESGDRTYTVPVGTFFTGSVNHLGLIADDDANAASSVAFKNISIYETAQTPPSAPSALTATAVSSSRINLSWTDNSTDESNFQLERKLGSAGTWEQITTPVANATSYQDIGLTSVTEYFYRLRASNDAGDSAYTDEVAATTLVTSTTFYWDADGSASGNTTSGASLGGSGTLTTAGVTWWDGTAPYLLPTSGGPQVSGPNTVVFNGTAGTVNVTSGLDDADIQSLTINSAHTFAGTANVSAQGTSTGLLNFTYDVAGSNSLDISNLTLTSPNNTSTARTYTVGDADAVTVKATSMAALVKNGNGTLAFSDSSTFNTNSHNMTINAGVVSIGSGSESFIRDNGGNFKLTLSGGATLQSRADINLGNGNAGTGSGAAIRITGSGSLEVVGTTTLSLRGHHGWLEGSGTLTKSGTGTLALENGRRITNAKNYTGSLVVSQGSLLVLDDVASSTAIDRVSSSADATADTITLPSNPGFALGDKVVVNGGSQGGLTAAAIYYVTSVSGGTSNILQLSTTPGGAAVDITGSSNSIRLSRVSTLGVSTSSTITLGDANSGANPIGFLTGPLATGSARDIRVERNITVAAQGGAVTLGGNADVNSIFFGTITLNKNVSITSAATAGNTVNFSGVISGAADVNLSGTGNVTFSADHTYSGNTSAPSGTNLTLVDDASLKFTIPATNGGNSSISGAGTVTLNGDFEIDTALPEAALLSSGTWLLENLSNLPSAYGTTFQVTSGGTPWSVSGDVWTKSVGAQNYTFNEVGGTLTLTSSGGPTYASWIAGYNLPGSPADADPDNDSLENAIEMILGGNPASEMNAGLAPTLSLVTANLGIGPADYFLFSYRRAAIAVAAGVAAVPEYNPQLGAAWTPAIDGNSGVVIQKAENFHGPGSDKMDVYIPCSHAVSGKLFGRLKALVP